jgi:quercetin dioxygenase-like cupin family protein
VRIIRQAETTIGPSERFTGAVYVDVVAEPAPPAQIYSTNVHFTPGARTAWHTHHRGQTILITEGVGLVQRRGGPVEVVRAGDRVFFDPGEDHWHGAAPDRLMVHLSMVENDEDGNNTVWGRHVSDEEYGAGRAADA